MTRVCGRPSYLKILEDRYYKIGRCLYALKIFGPLSSVDLARETGIAAQGLRNLLGKCDEIQFTREPYDWFYESTGDRENKTVRRDILVFSYTEVIETA